MPRRPFRPSHPLRRPSAVLASVTSFALAAALWQSAPALAQTVPPASIADSGAADAEQVKAVVAAVIAPKSDAERVAALARVPKTAASREFCRAAIDAGR